MGAKDKKNEPSVTELRKAIVQYQNTKEKLQQELTILEGKTQATADWVEANEQDIILGYNAIASAIKQDNAAKALTAIEGLGETASLVLDIPAKATDGATTSLTEWATGNLSGADALITKMNAIEKGIPASVYADFDDEPIVLSSDSAPEIEEEEKTGFWGRLTGSKTEEIQAELERAKNELTSLATEVPYYVDSFYDWVENSVAPEDEPLTGRDAAQLQLQWTDMDYILTKAQGDFAATLKAYSEREKETAHDYHDLVWAFQTGDAAQTIKVLEELHQKKHFQKIVNWALIENGKPSLADWALKAFDSKAGQATVLAKVMQIGQPLTFSDAETDQAIFEKFLWEVLDTDNPMPTDALGVVLERIKKQHDKRDHAAIAGHEESDGDGREVIEELLFSRLTNGTFPLTTIVNILGANSDRGKALLTLALQATEKYLNEEVVRKYAGIMQALEDQDPRTLRTLLNGCMPKVVDETLALAYTIDPKFSLVDQALYFRTGDDIGMALDAALSIGAPLVIYGADNQPLSAEKAFDLILEKTLNGKSPLPESTLERTVDYIIKTEGLGTFRDILLKTRALERMLKATDGKPAQQNTISAILLQPFPSDIARANVLYDSADNAGQKYARTLTGIGDAMAGVYLAHSPHNALNYAQVANLWAEKSGPRYIASGSHQQLDKMSVEESFEYINFLARQPGFIKIRQELINPALMSNVRVNGDSIAYTSRGILSQVDITGHYAEPTMRQIERTGIFVKAGERLLNAHETSYIMGQSEDGDLHVVTAQEYDYFSPGTKTASDVAHEISAIEDGFVGVEGRAVNTKHTSIIWIQDDELRFGINNVLYANDADAQYPGITATPKEIATIQKQLAAKPYLAQVGNIYINTDLLTDIHYNAEEQVLHYVYEGKDCRIDEVDSALAQTTIDTINAKDNFIAVNGRMFNLDLTADVWFENNSCILLSGEKKCVVPFDAAATGRKPEDTISDIIDEISQRPNFIQTPTDLINADLVTDIWFKPGGGKQDGVLEFLSHSTITSVPMTEKFAAEIIAQLREYGETKRPAIAAYKALAKEHQSHWNARRVDAAPANLANWHTAHNDNRRAQFAKIKASPGIKISTAFSADIIDTTENAVSLAAIMRQKVDMFPRQKLDGAHQSFKNDNGMKSMSPKGPKFKI